MQDKQLYTNFSKETWDKFKAERRPGPIYMLNLIQLREHAEYPDGRVSTGADAYKCYSEISAPVFQELGGRIVWRGEHEMSMVGPQNEAWDIAFIAGYPSVEAFLVMMKSSIYREAMSHRQAGVQDSRLMRFGTSIPGASFEG